MIHKKKLYIGVYISTSHYGNLLEALEKTIELGANVLQVYMGDNVHTTLSKKLILSKEEILRCKNYIKKYDIQFFVHSILSLNFCKDPLLKRNKWAIDNIVYDINLGYQLGGLGIVVHLGTYKTDKMDLSYEEGVNNFIQSLILVLEQTKKIPILLETPVNKKYRIGSNLENLAEIFHQIPLKYRKRIKICIDTQHIFASGYNIRSLDGIKNYLLVFDQLIGIKNLSLIHLNDSDKNLGSQINRHQSLKNGFIFKNNGEDSLNYIIHFLRENQIPALMESNYYKYVNEIPYLKQLGGVEKKKDIKNKIIKIFNTLVSYYQSKEEKDPSNEYRIDSYLKAIKILEKMETPIYNVSNVSNKNYIGKRLIEKIKEIAKTGTLKQYENIQQKNNLNAIQLFQNIWGIGPKLAKELINKNLHSIHDLKEAIKTKKIVLTNQQEIGLKYYNHLKKKIGRLEIEEYTNYLKDILKDLPIEIYNAGSYRSGKEYSGDIDIIITIDQDIEKNPTILEDLNKKIYQLLSKNNFIYEILLSGINKNIFIVKLLDKVIFRKIDLVIIKNEDLPWYLLYFGSSREFSKKIRAIASKKGYKLNEKGIFDKKTGEKIPFYPKEEEEIFHFLNIHYVKPKNR